MRAAIRVGLVVIVTTAGAGCHRRSDPAGNGSGAAGAGSAGAAGAGSAGAGSSAGTRATPAPVPFAIVKCELDGPPIKTQDKSFSQVIYAIATVPGALYLIDDAGAIRRYKLGAPAPAPCTLSLDPAFGTAGVLTVPDGIAKALATDAAGALYASAEDHRLIRVSPTGAIELECRATGFTSEDIAASPDGTYVLAEDFYGEWKRIAITGEPCKVDAWKPPFPTQFTPSLDFVGGRVILVSKGEISKAYEVHALRPDGAIDAELKTASELGDDAMVCESAGAAPCGANICVVDNNCRAIHEWTQEGVHVRKRELAPHFPSSPWVERIAARDGVIYLAVALDAGPEQYTGEVYRVQGL